MNLPWAPYQTDAIDSPAAIIYKIAATPHERARAFRLTYQAYRRAGLCPPNSHQMRVTPYQLLPTTEIFIAQLEQEVICTVSLVADGELGLPMETIYPEEIARRRQAGNALAEVSCLADRRSNLARSFPVFLELCRLMVQSARWRGVDQLLVAVHPRHARFYRRYMAFEPFGEIRSYPSVCDNLAVALVLDFARVDRERPRSYDIFFGEPMADEALRPCPLTEPERETFHAIADCDGRLPLVAQHAHQRGPEAPAAEMDF